MISLYCRSNSSWFVYNLIQQSDWLNKNVMVLRGSFVGPNISMSVLKHSKGSDDSIVEVGGQDVPASWDPPASPSRLAIGAGVTCWFLIQVLQLTLECVQTFLLSFWRIVHAQVNLYHCCISIGNCPCVFSCFSQSVRYGWWRTVNFVAFDHTVPFLVFWTQAEDSVH
jgi:hypothetical protein